MAVENERRNGTIYIVARLAVALPVALEGAAEQISYRGRRVPKGGRKREETLRGGNGV